MSIFEMQYQGTTTVLDHAHATWSDEHVDAAVNASFQGEIRSYFAYAVQTLPNGYTWDDQLSKIRSLANESRFWQVDGRIKLGIAYDSFYAAPETNISTLWDLVTECRLPLVTTHYVGGPWGAENSPEVLNNYGWLNTSVPVVFSHGSFLTYEDAAILRQTNQYLCSTPESEFHYGHVNPSAHHIQDQAALGVDTHFTFSATMVQQARLWLQSLRRELYLDPEEERWELPLNNPMSVEQAFYLITRAGALALRRPDLGAIKIGAMADIVVFGTDSPNMVGASDPIAAIVLHSDVGDVEDVLVDGLFVKKNGKLMSPEYQSTKIAFIDSAKRIQEHWAQIQWEPLEDFQSGLSGPTARIPVIDTQRGPGTGY
jgi:cytosine/adenosine deaminase-related metal-dependent hydrolase